MKTIHNYLQEALIKKDTKIKKLLSIEDAKDGDIITATQYFEETKYTWKATFIFNNIYKGLSGYKKVNFHCYYIWPENRFYWHKKDEKGSIGNVEEYLNGEIEYWLASKAEERKLFEELKNVGCKWNPIKKEIEKI